MSGRESVGRKGKEQLERELGIERLLRKSCNFGFNDVLNALGHVG